MPKYKNVMMKAETHAALSDFAAALGCSRAEAIARLLKVQKVIKYVRGYTQPYSSDNYETYRQVLSWFELAGLTPPES